jgi:hypothetical protein
MSMNAPDIHSKLVRRRFFCLSGSPQHLLYQRGNRRLMVELRDGEAISYKRINAAKQKAW